MLRFYIFPDLAGKTHSLHILMPVQFAICIRALLGAVLGHNRGRSGPMLTSTNSLSLFGYFTSVSLFVKSIKK